MAGRNHIVIVTLALAALTAPIGCGVDVEPPTEKISTKAIKGASDAQVVKVEKCIEKRDPTLPSKVQRLIDYLGGLTRNVTVGEGSKYGTTEQAVADIDRAVGKLRAWYNRSRMHPEQGVSDEDRAELQRILDEVRAVLVEVKVGPN